MSRFVERSMTCRHCGETFHGYGRGPNGEKRAYREAMAFLKAHECLPLENPGPLPRISGADLDAMIEVIQNKLPGVTITRHKV
jgi:hypothetical protein